MLYDINFDVYIMGLESSLEEEDDVVFFSWVILVLCIKVVKGLIRLFKLSVLRVLRFRIFVFFFNVFGGLFISVVMV